ncbi:hypothetical protein ACFQY0_10775 [Haloferula chungangensis]|uniref:Uncharacterized protein n=2 Tax=Haloferula chungangensis TaxID=1048331 RepID=A0ABW2L839_9BACT
MQKVTLENYRQDRYYPKVVAAVKRLLAKQRHVSPVEVLMEMGVLMADDRKRWQRGQVPYLEKVIRCNLSKAGRILRILRFHAHDLNLGPSMTAYRHGKQVLRFSKTGVKAIEEAYARHFVVIGKQNPFEAKPRSSD